MCCLEVSLLRELLPILRTQQAASRDLFETFLELRPMRLEAGTRIIKRQQYEEDISFVVSSVHMGLGPWSFNVPVPFYNQNLFIINILD